jgi:transposase
MRQFFAAYPDVVCAVESCRGYEWLLDFLKEDLKLTVELVNPYRTKLITQSRCKTDRIDSKVIMELLAKGFLPTCYQPTPEERRVRERLRWRAHVVRYATRMKVRIHALLDKENAGLSCDPFSVEGRKLLKQIQLRPGRQELLTEHIRILEFFEAAVKEEDSWVHKTAKSNAAAKLLMTIPGIGELSAVLLVHELGDIKRFKDASSVAAYFGLVPSVHSSADRFRYGPITKQGSKHVRWMLIQCAWQAIRVSLPLRYHFNAVSRRCGRNPAVVSVARKLVKTAYRVLRDNKAFNAELVGTQEPA